MQLSLFWNFFLILNFILKYIRLLKNLTVNQLIHKCFTNLNLFLHLVLFYLFLQPFLLSYLLFKHPIGLSLFNSKRFRKNIIFFFTITIVNLTGLWRTVLFLPITNNHHTLWHKTILIITTTKLSFIILFSHSSIILIIYIIRRKHLTTYQFILLHTLKHSITSLPWSKANSITYSTIP
jgi:hypothetical protein